MSSNPDNKNNKKVLKLSFVNTLILVVSVLFSFLMAYFGYNVIKDYNSLQETVNIFRTSQVSGTQVRTASDFLTTQARKALHG